MKVALVGDVHANLPALEAVLAHAALQGVDAIWNTGDFVGYGAFPDLVVRRLQAAGALSIRGNYDTKALKAPQKAAKWQGRKHPDKILAFQWAYDHLSPESRVYLAGLPKEIRFQAEGWQILLTHGSPESVEEHLSPATPETRLAQLAALTSADVIIFGHSHRAFVRKAAGKWFINTGSVGRPDDGDPRACYALLYLEPGTLGVCHIRVAYDLEAALQAIRQNGLPEAFADMISNGRNLDQILEQD